ncbi:DEAD/DEAH box helicase [Saccharospirillum alexandrii]|uniref:DEAD/DEAH box helicase n=1 Tax=Saccharospirillum alexandrii TaxID=2448477 RepID=UPI000FDAC445|nr:DEAD/DEAH box helicase [Saccharospirillum alexandrii]
MSLNHILSTITSSEYFLSQYEEVIEKSGAKHLNRYSATNTLESYIAQSVDWKYLLKVANLLTFSNNFKDREKALRIVTSCILFADDDRDHKSSSISLLRKMSNFRTIELAKKKGLIEKSLIEDINNSEQTVSEILAETKIDLISKIFIGKNQYFIGNSFQNQLWDSFHSNRVISASAPTSAGKSFVLYKILLNHLVNNSSSNLLYLVPTRALINQVYSDLKSEIAASNLDVDIVTLPLEFLLGSSKRKVFIFTQERLHILLASIQPKFDVIFVDEAHKIGDSYRGVLLQHAISKAENSNTKIVYTSPFSENPEKIKKFHLENDRFESVHTSEITVNQNVFWVNSEPRSTTKWIAKLAGDNTRLQSVSLRFRPITQTKRLAFLSAEFGGDQSGNLVYVNRPSDAENVCRLISGYLDSSDVEDKEIEKLIELSERVLHKDYSLAKVLRKGLAFHYGNLPQIIRSKIEELFAQERIKFLACTSTLVEGVNMSCKNIFLRGPKKGAGNPMLPEDFWNLAGRAGRWGIEFQGNIFCIDTEDSVIWPYGPPKERQEYRIESSIERSLSKTDKLISYIGDGLPRIVDSDFYQFNYVISFFFDLYQKGELREYIDRFVDSHSSQVLYDLIRSNFELMGVYVDISINNPGVNPAGILSLRDYFIERKDRLEDLIPSDPASLDALDSYVRVFARINKTLSQSGDEFGNHKRSFMLALLVVNWMQGNPIAKLIKDREKQVKKKGSTTSINTVVRNVLEDVEKYARFIVPKYLACYLEVLESVANEQEIEIDISALEQLQISLEFGVSSQTHLALIRLGLSRTSAIAIGALIADDKLTDDGAKVALREIDLASSDLPALVREEISAIIDEF